IATRGALRTPALLLKSGKCVANRFGIVRIRRCPPGGIEKLARFCAVAPGSINLPGLVIRIKVISVTRQHSLEVRQGLFILFIRDQAKRQTLERIIAVRKGAYLSQQYPEF